MAASLTLSVVEIIVLLFGAIILGITIHFFIASRKSFKTPTEDYNKNTLAKDEWKRKYFNDMEVREKEIGELKSRLQESEENASISSMEAEEMHRNYKTIKAEFDKFKTARPATEATDNTIVDDLRRQVKQLQYDLENAKQHSANTGVNENAVNEDLRRQIRQLQNELEVARDYSLPAETSISHKPKDYLDQLKEAQHSLIEQNEKINKLLGNIDVIKEKEEMQQLILRSNEELSAQVEAMQVQLETKEHEIHTIKQKENLTKEMSSMLDHAYTDFNILKEKIQKLESQLTTSKLANMEFEDLKEAHAKMNSDVEDLKIKNTGLTSENQELKLELSSAEDQLRESNFQRLQLQKRVAYLEELNLDLQVVSDANKKLEGQLKRIGELESMLNMVSEERDNLISKTPDAKI